jgi:hypothetical protein
MAQLRRRKFLRAARRAEMSATRIALLIVVFLLLCAGCALLAMLPLIRRCARRAFPMALQMSYNAGERRYIGGIPNGEA